MQEMFAGIDKVLKGTLDKNIKPIEEGNVRPIHILDIGNLIGNNVVVGGVRRTAEIFLMDSDDWECIFAKYGINGIWNEGLHKNIIEKMEKLNLINEETKWLYDLKVNDFNARPMHHRRMSNNSIAFNEKPSEGFLDLIFTIMQGEGEPGFINLEAANKRRPNAKGLNPCAEILLDSYGVCNLSTINVKSFVKEVTLLKDDGTDGDTIYQLDYQGLMQAQALSTRAGIRMTCVDLELPHWDEVQKRDRLIGCSLTGWKDAMDLLGYDKDQERNLLEFLSNVARETSIKYAHILRIPTPLLDTTVKPEGTLSQVAGGVSSGLHVSHAPYYIRRIRINANDPLVDAVKELGWTINPEVGTLGSTYEEQMANARTYVIDFPIKSGAKTTRADQTVKSQFDTYFMFQEAYTSQNSSNTISVRPDEWDETKQIVWDGWNDFIGVSFLSYDGGSYQLAPYEECTEEEYETLKSKMKPFNPEILKKYEKGNLDDLEMEESGCENGICPIR